MARPEDVLSAADYRNYRNVRAVALLFIILGSILVLGGVGMAAEKGDQNWPGLMRPVVGAVVAVVGLAGTVGGVAIRRGSRRWAPLAKVMAWVYLFGFPVGTILSFTLLTGLSRYLKSVDRIRRAEVEDEDWNDEEGEDT